MRRALTCSCLQAQAQCTSCMTDYYCSLPSPPMPCFSATGYARHLQLTSRNAGGCRGVQPRRQKAMPLPLARRSCSLQLTRSPPSCTGSRRGRSRNYSRIPAFLHARPSAAAGGWDALRWAGQSLPATLLLYRAPSLAKFISESRRCYPLAEQHSTCRVSAHVVGAMAAFGASAARSDIRQ